MVPLRWTIVVLRTGRRSRPLRADVAQLVAHNLAKVGVAGSNPVVRSVAARLAAQRFAGGQAHSVEWPRGEATACKAVYTGSNPVSTSERKAGPARFGAAVALGDWRSGSALP